MRDGVLAVTSSGAWPSSESLSSVVSGTAGPNVLDDVVAGVSTGVVSATLVVIARGVTSLL